MEYIDLIVKLSIPLFGVVVSIFAFRWKIRKDRLQIIEQSLSELQRFNEIALSSRENLKAAILSANPDDTFEEENARIIYVQFLRINRMFKALMYFQHKIIDELEAQEIIKAHARTLKSIPENQLRVIMQRGYPTRFTNYLINILKALPATDPIWTVHE